MRIDPAKTKSLATYPHAGKLYSLCSNPDGTRLCAGSSDYAVYVFDPASEKKEPIAKWEKHDNYVSALAYLPGAEGQGGDQVVSGSYDRRLIWWNAETGEVVRTVDAHDGWVRDVAALAGGKLIVSVGDDMLVKLWDARSGGLLRAMEGHAKRTPQGHVTALYVVAVSPDGKHLASADRIGEVRVWEAGTGELVSRFQVPVLYTYDPRQRKRSIGGIRALAFSADGNLLAVGGIGQVGNVDGLGGAATVEVWNWRMPERFFQAEADGHKGLINHLAYHPDSGWLIGAGGGSDSALIAFWKPTEPTIAAGPHRERERAGQAIDASEPATDSAAPNLTVHRIKADGHIHRFCLSPSGDRLYAAGHGKLEVWWLSG